MSKLTRVLAAASATMAFGGTVLAAAPPASAASRDGVCDSGEFCYYFNSGNQGSVSDFTTSVADYATTQPTCYDFKGPGAGKGTCVKNSAAAAWNRTAKTVRVYFNSGYSGSYQDFAPGAKADLNATLKNQNASHQIGPSSAARSNMSYALYKASGGRITCGFDGYTSTSGRHEGIDFARGVGSNVYSLVAGEVVSVVRGATGRANLSTIAIYNAASNKTVIYLHSAPLSALRAGQRVSRGQAIATESWRGVSSRSSAHTHVEVRAGRVAQASKSVGDPHLDNANPAAFWAAQGYHVR
ncbi:peptidoglycan DD-metalloendopeptidase family protein [Actinomadura sp. ATCC 31491]|uniref:Peptidoglycan DD-metalloendopeptidase family protein n=1 Tax=Actinomadura luzonensis TaxID=2805427 RepID=A0ABT0FN07_9ACTN|nr:peptidoglycan DD-metalloendopeptidase family protein [Actinomadura luzonensis]MCK2213732.1 peptidoglycan DD-metalloendopeptidase family protein [Actinomadura luzonensis]